MGDDNDVIRCDRRRS